MAKKTLFQALKYYEGAWRRPLFQKAYVVRTIRPVGAPLFSQPVAVIIGDATGSNRLADAGTLLDLVWQVKREETTRVMQTKRDEEDTLPVGLDELWDVADKKREAGPEIEVLRAFVGSVLSHDIAHPGSPWDWTCRRCEDEPLAAYVSFQAAAQEVPRMRSLPSRIGGFARTDDLRQALVSRLLGEVGKGSTARLLANLKRGVRELSQATLEDLLDSDTPLDVRCQLLQKLVSSEEDRAARLIVEQLSRVDLSSSWRDALVLCAEAVQFCDDELRSRLRKRLLELALELRVSTEAGIRPVVCSAIRTYVSLIPPSSTCSLIPFLEPPRPVETRLVTLQSIVNLCAAHPTCGMKFPESLTDRIYELADKFLDRDWLVPGEKAAIGENATHALAAMGDERVRACIEKIRLLRMPWLVRQVARKLNATLNIWHSEGIDAFHPSSRFLREQLALLSP